MGGLIGVIKKENISKDEFINYSAILKHYNWQKVDAKKWRNIFLGRVHLSKFNKHKQPMFNKKKDKCVIFEGYLYDYEEIIRCLNLIKYNLKNLDSYAEIALGAYELFGDACVEHLKGEFSFAIYDFKQKKLTIINDRFGLRPIYYTNSIKNNFIFSSEIKGILVNPDFKRKVNKKAIFDLITTGWIIGDEVNFKGIFFLPPASILKYHDGKTSLKKYWDFSFVPKIDKEFNELKTELNSKFHEAIRKIVDLQPKLKYGVFLSGGLDSRFIAGHLSRITPHFSTFTYGHKKLEDQIIAKKIASRLKTTHLNVDFKFHEVPEYIKDVVWLNEGIYCAMNVFGLNDYQLFQKNASCNLSGVGGDVLAADIDFYISLPIKKTNINLLRKAAWLDSSIKEKKLTNIKTGNKIRFDKKIVKLGLNEFFTYYYFKSRCQHFISYNTTIIKNNFFENISPFFNYEYFDFMTKVPYEYKHYKKLYRHASYDAFPEIKSIKWNKFKLNTNETNYILLEKYENILNLIKKGIRKYLQLDLTQTKYDLCNIIRNDILFKKLINNKILSDQFKNRKIFNFSEVKKTINAHMKGRFDYTLTIMMLLTIETWFEEFVDPKEIKPKMLGVSKLRKKIKN